MGEKKTVGVVITAFYVWRGTFLEKTVKLLENTWVLRKNFRPAQRNILGKKNFEKNINLQTFLASRRKEFCWCCQNWFLRVQWNKLSEILEKYYKCIAFLAVTDNYFKFLLKMLHKISKLVGKNCGNLSEASTGIPKKWQSPALNLKKADYWIKILSLYFITTEI